MSAETIQSLTYWSQRCYPASVEHSGGASIRKLYSTFKKEISIQCRFELTEYSVFFMGVKDFINDVVCRYATKTNIMPHVIVGATDIKTAEYCHSLYMNSLCQLTILPVQKYGNGFGTISVSELKLAIRPNTCLISILGVDGDTGIINDISGLSAVAKRARIPFYSDMGQLLGKSIVNPSIGLDAFSASLQLLGGYPGVDVLVVKNQLIRGFGLTLSDTGCNPPGIGASLVAFQTAAENRSKKNIAIQKHRKTIQSAISAKLQCFYVGEFPGDTIPSIDGGITPPMSSPIFGTDKCKRAINVSVASSPPIVFWLCADEKRVLPNTILLAIYRIGFCNKLARLALEKKNIIVSAPSSLAGTGRTLPSIIGSLAIPQRLQRGVIHISMNDNHTPADIMTFVKIFLEVISGKDCILTDY